MMAASGHAKNQRLLQEYRARFKVWNFSKQRSNKMVLCTLRKTEMAYHSITYMDEHLKRKHSGALLPLNDEMAA